MTQTPEGGGQPYCPPLEAAVGVGGSLEEQLIRETTVVGGLGAAPQKEN